MLRSISPSKGGSAYVTAHRLAAALAAATSLVMLANVNTARAQSAQYIAPSQVTPRSFVPSQSTGPRTFEISAAAGLTAPAGAEQFSLVVGRVDLEGGFPELDESNAALAARLSGKRITVAEIFAAAADLERAYANAGYALVRLTVPPQKLVDGGPVRLIVLNGFIEEVKVDGVPERVRDVVAARARALVDRRGLRLAEIERLILIAGDFSGLQLRSALARGRETGGSVLVIEGEHRLVTGAVNLDNRLPSALSGKQGTISASINSALGFGEQLYVSAGSAMGDVLNNFPFVQSPLRVLGVGATAPVGDNGVTVNPEYTYSHSTRAQTLQTLGTTGAFQRFAMRANYPMIRERTRTLIAKADVEYVKQHVFASDFELRLNADRYRAARFDLDWQSATPWGAPYRVDIQLSKGLGGRNGADALWSETPLSRQGASPWFTKLSARGWLSQPLPANLQANIIGVAQTSFGEPLLLPEQMSVEGPEQLSGLPPGLVLVDTGGTLRGELAYLQPGPASDYGLLALSPYVFVAGGLGRIHQATIVEKSTLRAGSFGVGLRTNYNLKDGFSGIMLGVEFGQEYSNIPGRAAAHRVNAYGGMRF